MQSSLGPVGNFPVSCGSPFQQAPSKAQEAKRAGFTMNDDRTVSADAVRARMAPRRRKEERPRGRRGRQPSFYRGRFPARCRMTRTSSARLRTARLSRRTGRRPAQGGHRNRALAVPAGVDEQDGGGRGRSWPSRALCSSSGTGPRSRWHAGSARGSRVRGSDWGRDAGRGLACQGGGEAGCAMAVMPSRRSRTVPRNRDGEMCKWRHQVENFLAKTGEFRVIATRYDKRDKTGASHAAAIHLAAGVMAAKQLSTGPIMSIENQLMMSNAVI